MTEEEIKYHNRLWYYKTYNQLIDKCIQMEKDGYPEDMYTEVHHILPKCQGGTDEKCNLVRMPVRYHIMAHLLLAKAFPNEPKIIYAIGIMLIGNKHTKFRKEILNEKFSTRTISWIREESSKFKKGEKTQIMESIFLKKQRRKFLNLTKENKYLRNPERRFPKLD